MLSASQLSPHRHTRTDITHFLLTCGIGGVPWGEACPLRFGTAARSVFLSVFVGFLDLDRSLASCWYACCWYLIGKLFMSIRILNRVVTGRTFTNLVVNAHMRNVTVADFID